MVLFILKLTNFKVFPTNDDLRLIICLGTVEDERDPFAPYIVDLDTRRVCARSIYGEIIQNKCKLLIM